VSFLDVMIGQVVREYYRAYPGSLTSNEKQISLRDLREFGSIEAAEEYILEKEVDAVLRGSLKDQLDYFGQRLSLKLSCLDNLLPDLVETIQRRHILIHNGGRVNNLYLDRVSADAAERSEAKLGEPIRTTGDYIEAAIDRIHLAGIMIIQTAWRKWKKSECEAADADINEHVYFAIQSGRYRLAEEVSRFGCSLQFAREADRRNLVLNRAQALKWQGKEEEMEAVISSEDWGASGLRYIVAIHALRDNEEKFFELVPKAVAADALAVADLREWPIFQGMRGPRMDMMIDTLGDAPPSSPDEVRDGVHEGEGESTSQAEEDHSERPSERAGRVVSSSTKESAGSSMGEGGENL
jgi:hypothetical protein